MIRYDYSALRQVFLECDAASLLPTLLTEHGCDRAFILASATLHRETAAIEGIQDALGNRCAGVFARIGAHSPRPDVMRALAAVRDSEADLLISVGGGSIIDAAKAVQFCINGGIRDEAGLLAYGRFSDGTAGERAGQWQPDPSQKPLCHLAVPTTLSAAEYSDNAGLSDPQRGRKEGYRAESLCPRSILYDPRLVRHTPQWLWLSTAIRSLDHAVEGYCSTDSHAYMQGQYLHALRLLFRSLPECAADPDSLSARSANQQAVWLAGCALGRVRHGASHGIGYILGAAHGIPHGYTSCVLLPAVLRWNRETTLGAQQELAAAMGDTGEPADQLLGLLQTLGLPCCLRDVGLRREDLPDIAEAAARHPVVRNNPRPIRSPDDVREILELAF